MTGKSVQKRDSRYMSSDRSLNERMEQLFAEKLNVRVPSEDTDLIETGLIDSLALVELLFEVEREFGVALPLGDLEVDDFRTIRRMGEFVRKLGAVEGV